MAHKSYIRHTWQYNKMMALVRGLDLETVEDYFQYIISSKINGNLLQVRDLFRDMPIEYRKEFLSYLADEVERESNGNTVYYQLLKLLIEEI